MELWVPLKIMICRTIILIAITVFIFPALSFGEDQHRSPVTSTQPADMIPLSLVGMNVKNGDAILSVLITEALANNPEILAASLSVPDDRSRDRDR